MFSIGFMTWGAEGVLVKGLDRYGTVGTGFWCGYGRGCSEYGTGTGAGTGTGTVRVRYGHGTGTGTGTVFVPMYRTHVPY